jgi:putative copper resistance protein D
LLAPTFFQGLHLPWMVDLLADQRTGGAVAWGIGELPTLILALLVTLAWVRSDHAETTRLDRKAEQDDDAELKAYNAHLSALSGQSGEPALSEPALSEPIPSEPTWSQPTLPGPGD